jgi:hypothetical protein
VTVFGRALRDGLLGKARALFHGLGPKGEYPSRGYYVVTCYRLPGERLTDYRELRRDLYRWRWLARLSVPSWFEAGKLDDGQWAFIMRHIEAA